MKLSTKILVGLSFFIMFLLGWGAWDIRQNNIKTISSGEVHAGILDDITTAVTGHINDVIDRQKDDEFISGNIIKKAEFTLSKDSIHYVNGSLQVIESKGKTYIQLNEDFASGLAPDLYILTSEDIIDSQSDLDNTNKMNLIKLKKGSGASYYEVEGNIKSVVIWCQAFNQWMGSAIL